MSIETYLRDAFHEAAAATPAHADFDDVLARSQRARRRSTIVRVSAGAVAVLIVVAGSAVALRRSTMRSDVVSAGAPIAADRANFPGGPSVALHRLESGKLAFVSGSRLYVVDANDSTARRLTKQGDASDVSWSSDGEWLAFSVRDAPGYEDYTTWISRPDGSGARALTGKANVFAWSPTGHRLAIAGDCCALSGRVGGVYVVDPDGSDREIVEPGTQIITVAWAPDGETIGYTSAAIDGRSAASDGVWTVGVDGADARRIGTAMELASFSPDGRSVLVRSADPDRVELVTLADSVRHPVGQSAAFDARYPAVWSAWSPDGEQVAVVTDVETRIASTVVVCDTAVASCRAVPGLEAQTEAVVGPTFSPDGAQLAIVADGALALLDLAGGSPRPIDRLGADLLQGAGDGVTITRGTAPNVPEWLADGTILYRHGAQLRVVDPRGGSPQVIAEPVGFADPGDSDQGLPGGTPIGTWQLTSRIQPPPAVSAR